MRLHSRTPIVEQAESELGLFVVELCRKYSLTRVELLQMFAKEIQTTLKYALRAERHPKDPDKPADEA